jgi:hypothetical protein
LFTIKGELFYFNKLIVFSKILLKSSIFIFHNFFQINLFLETIFILSSKIKEFSSKKLYSLLFNLKENFSFLLKLVVSGKTVICFTFSHQFFKIKTGLIKFSKSQSCSQSIFIHK